jgi:hypothetical protein
MAKQKSSSWLDKYQDGGWTVSPKVAAYNKAARQQPTNIDANAMQALGQVTSYPQRKITEWITGTNQYPSQAMGITNPYGAFAVDAVLDPTNIVGAGLLGKAAKASSKASKVAKVAKTVAAPNKQIISSTGNFFNELADKILPREVPVQQSIDAGNQWTKDWISHPATQEKMMRDFDKMEQTAPWTSHSYKQHSLNYDPNSKLYPLSQQAKDLAQIIWQGKTSYGSKAMVHADNMGVSYRHTANPLDDAANASIYPRFGTWISRNPKYSHSQIKSTVGHENFHDWLRQPILVESGQFHDIQNTIKPEYLDYYNQWESLRQSGKTSKEIDKIMGKENAYKAYLADPTEVHARIGELRQKYDLSPSQTITAKDVQNMRGGEGLPGNVVDKRFFDVFNNDNGSSFLFNRLWAAPAAVGVGAAAMANQPEQKNGGWLEKYNDGGPVQPNYNDASVSMSKDFVGDGYSNVGRNYSPAWGGQFAMGGSMPGSVGFMYARTGDIPSNGPYAKKTKASAENGKEIKKNKEDKTYYSGMLPEITVVGSKDPQTEEFYRTMLDRLTKEEGYRQGISSDDPVYNDPKSVDMVYNYPNATDNILGRYEGLMDLGKKYGFPKVHPVDKNSLLSKMATTVGGDSRPPANYDASSKTIQADSTKDWVSEMAHHIQMKDNRLNKTIQWMKNDLPALAISEIMLRNRFGQYHIPGTVEHEAHSVIEPKLLEEMKKSESQYKNNPYRKKKRDEFYGDNFYKNLGAYENGGEMKYYQQGLDFKPKTISKDGSQLVKLDQLTNFTNYNTKQPGGWLDKYQ